MEPLKTGLEWAAEHGIVIYDPDGWRHNDGVTVNTLISEHEFWRRVMESTVSLAVMDESLEQETESAATVAE